MNGPAIIIVGNPVEGYVFYGPFDSYDVAVEHADKYTPAADWWVAPILPKEAL